MRLEILTLVGRLTVVMTAEVNKLLCSVAVWEDNNWVGRGYQMQLERLYNLKALLVTSFDANR